MMLSVIIPVYNGVETIAFAIESVVYQNTNFDYEIIVYDDCSIDGTKDIVQSYITKFPQIRYYANNKNYGNAQTFYNATKTASGKYLHVLDADDFFISWNKLQKQVDFLEANPNFCAVGHESIRLTRKSINLANLNNITEKTFNYEYDVNKIFGFYMHTSTMMFKNVFKNGCVKILNQSFCRGDEIRVQLVRAITSENIKRLSLVGSLYNYNEKGIWSSLSQEQQQQLSIDYLRARSKFIFSGIEKRSIDHKLSSLIKRGFKNVHDESYSLNHSLHFIRKKIARVIHSDPKRREDIFLNCNFSSQADELLEAIGRICLFNKNHLIHGSNYDVDCFLIAISGFKSFTGGGIIREILEFVETFLLAGKHVVICSTEEVETDEDVISLHFNKPNLLFIRAEGDTLLSKLDFLIDKIIALKPIRMYPFVTHTDVVGAALIQKHLAGEIIMSWVYDHGTSLAISNSSISIYIAKNSNYFYTLKSFNKHNKVNIIPASFEQKNNRIYVPFKNHSKLITATASARSYKVETEYTYSYIDIVAEILGKTSGKHYHYGPLSEKTKQMLQDALERNNICSEKFIHIEWVDDLSLSLISNEVDIFLASFPVGSARIAIEVNSIGIPILAHHGINRILSLKGFISPDNLWWENPDELFTLISHADSMQLEAISKKVRAFYDTNNAPSVTRPLLLRNESMPYCLEDVSPKSFVDLPIFGVNDKKFNAPKKIGYKIIFCCYKIPLVGKMLISTNKINKIRSYLVA